MAKQQIGFWGYPNPEIIANIKNEYPNAEWLDLDIDFGAEDKCILPDAYCKIIKNIVNNSFKFKPTKIVAPIGKDKCDSGWFVAQILREYGFDVVESIYEQKEKRNEINISTSNLPLFEKIETITNNIITPQKYNFEQCKAQFGFWGVPPNDMEILKLFPNNTHVYGWTRCVEAGTPADIELEMFVEDDVPTVFYSQSFCAKAQLAKYLANKYNGLYIDIDDYASNSIKAKIEAFLRLR